MNKQSHLQDRTKNESIKQKVAVTSIIDEMHSNKCVEKTVVSIGKRVDKKGRKKRKVLIKSFRDIWIQTVYIDTSFIIRYHSKDVMTLLNNNTL